MGLAGSLYCVNNHVYILIVDVEKRAYEMDYKSKGWTFHTLFWRNICIKKRFIMIMCSYSTSIGTKVDIERLKEQKLLLNGKLWSL